MNCTFFSNSSPLCSLCIIYYLQVKSFLLVENFGPIPITNEENSITDDLLVFGSSRLSICFQIDEFHALCRSFCTVPRLLIRRKNGSAVETLASTLPAATCKYVNRHVCAPQFISWNGTLKKSNISKRPNQNNAFAHTDISF